MANSDGMAKHPKMIGCIQLSHWMQNLLLIYTVSNFSL